MCNETADPYYVPSFAGPIASNPRDELSQFILMKYPKRGRRPALGPGDIEELLNIVKEKPKCTYRQLSEILFARTGLKISPAAISRTLHRLGFCRLRVKRELNSAITPNNDDTDNSPRVFIRTEQPEDLNLSDNTLTLETLLTDIEKIYRQIYLLYRNKTLESSTPNTAPHQYNKQ